MDDKDLKITALTQRIGEVSSQYEDKIADLRVVITRQGEQITELQNAAQMAEAEQAYNPSDKSNGEPDIVEGEVI